MAKLASKPKKSFLKQIRESLEDLEACHDVDLKESYRLPEKKKVRVSIKQYPIQLSLRPDGRALHLYPENPLDAAHHDDEPAAYILFDPEQFYTGISGFLRLEGGDKITIGPKEADHLAQLGIDPPSERLLSITNRDGHLVFKNHSGKLGSCISPLTSGKKINRIANWRYDKLKHIREIFGGPIELLSQKDALALIKSVNERNTKEAYRAKDNKGRLGGVLALPKKLNPILVGDLHAKPDNLLTLLTQNNFLESLEDGSASLIILGDAVHREDKGHYEEMESSLLMMDLIFKIKLRFPDQVFYICGNHDSFSNEIGKAGIPQGLLWKKAIIKNRGKEYLTEMENFYAQLPLLAYSKNFIACHAAPPVSDICINDLVNGLGNNKLYRELTSNRLRAPHRPGGYAKGDIKRLRKCLDVAEDTPVVVGHTPLSLDQSLWERVGDIENHYIVYGSHEDWISTLTMVAGRLRPLLYPVEPVTPLINSLND
ncbi:MAG: hypothetical protein B6D76_00535 [gamma proteobacterium symbiont of Stewartia floridana]|nr:MAG: hypothetical protein B6D76_00535 [gamma proteobacterium symbiont of Stewartia floridana]RLW58014.1 MAG: hypothetical protein B6D75_14885 [gamma proteobacterium symbiont of Stewartia floridana]